MRTSKRKDRLAVPALCLLLAGLLTPILAVGASVGATAPTSAQLSALISAAEESGLYAHSIVHYASSHGLSASSALNLLAQGDGLLDAARTYAQDSNLSAGVQSAQAAMKDYSEAAASAGLAISGAGLELSISYTNVEQAIGEVNATIHVVASAASEGCAQAARPPTPAAAFTQACAQLDADIAAADASLAQATALAAQANGQAGAGASFLQAMVLVEAARASMNSTQPELQTVASASYVQRAEAYLAAVIDPLYVQANSTLEAEGAVNSTLAQFQTSFLSYAQAQTSSAAGVAASASALAGAIVLVDTSAVTSGASLAEGIAAEVSSNVSALLALPGISSYTGVVSDADSCQSAAGSFVQAVTAAGATAGAYPQARLSVFSTYVAALTQAGTMVQSSGSAYASACEKVTSDLSTLAVPGVSTIYTDLAGLSVSGSVDGVGTSLAQMTSAASSVQSDIGSFANLVAAQSPAIATPPGLVSAAASVVAQALVYLNATGSSAMTEASASVQDVASSAESLIATMKSSTDVTVEAFVAVNATLSTDVGALGAQTRGSAAAVATAAAYLSSDIGSRLASTLAAKGDVAVALGLFSSMQVEAGVSAMEQASLELQAASAEGGQ